MSLYRSAVTHRSGYALGSGYAGLRLLTVTLGYAPLYRSALAPFRLLVPFRLVPFHRYPPFRFFHRYRSA